MKKIKKILIIVLVIFAVMLFLIFIKIILKPKTVKIEAKNSETEIKIDIDKDKKFSRVSFFVNTSHRASLAIPESWEGKYRQSEEGDIVRFLYIGNPSQKSELFRIKYYSTLDEALVVKNQEIIISNSKNFTYIKEKNNIYSGSEAQNFQAMINRVDDLMKDFNENK